MKEHLDRIHKLKDAIRAVKASGGDPNSLLPEVDKIQKLRLCDHDVAHAMRTVFHELGREHSGECCGPSE